MADAQEESQQEGIDGLESDDPSAPFLQPEKSSFQRTRSWSGEDGEASSGSTNYFVDFCSRCRSGAVHFATAAALSGCTVWLLHAVTSSALDSSAQDMFKKDLRGGLEGNLRYENPRLARRRGRTRQALYDKAEEGAGGSVLERLASAMRPYHSTPWYKLQPFNHSPSWGPLDYRDFPIGVSSRQCPAGTLSFKNAHAGDLLEHSKWTALQLAVWLKAGEKWTHGLDARVVITAGFLHDLGKAGDCAFSCIARAPPQNFIKDFADKKGARSLIKASPHIVEFASREEASRFTEHCYLDVYSPLKYERQDDSEHPVYSLMYLEPDDSLRFWLKCPKEAEMRRMWHQPLQQRLYRSSAKYRDDLYDVTNQLQSWKERNSAGGAMDYLTSSNILDGFKLSALEAYKVMVAARMHWDLGRMNMWKGDKRYLDADGYLKKFAAVMSSLAQCDEDFRSPDCIAGPTGGALFKCRDNKQSTRELLQMCIAIGAADISGASPSRASSRLGTDEVEFVSNAGNAALSLCKQILSNSVQTADLSSSALQLVGEICMAACRENGALDEDDQLDGKDCALTQRYPGLDVWSAYGFEAKGLDYREQLLLRYDEITSSDASYNEWCSTTMSDLAESPVIEFRPLIANASHHPNARTLYVQSLPLTGKEVSWCSSRGVVEGLCFKDVFGRCRVRNDITIQCSPTQSIRVSPDNKGAFAMPAAADGLAFIYYNKNPQFYLGGFVYEDKVGAVTGVSHLVDATHAGDKSQPVVFGGAKRAEAENYVLLRNALNSGLAMTGYQRELFPTLDATVSRYAWAITPEMPHGGFAYILK